MEQNKELETAKTLGIVSLICAFLFAPVGIVCGHISLSKFKKAAVTEGTGIAKAGLIISYIILALSIIFLITIFIFAGAAVATGLEGLEVPTE